MRAIDRLRARQRHPAAMEGAALLEGLASTEVDPSWSMENAELGARLRTVLSELPAEQSLVFALWHLGDLSYEEIAREVGLTPSAVGVVLHRTRERLKERLASLVAKPPNEVPHES
jgi:RNA polymerase sigma factor (sigma-70 family)